MKYNKASIDSAMKAAMKTTVTGGTLYVVATYAGYSVTKIEPFKYQRHYKVENGNATLIG